MPFWHGDKPGRPIELGRALGARRKDLSRSPMALDVGEHGPDFVIALLRRPCRHAGEFDAMLDDVKKFIGLPLGNLRWQMGRMRRHVAGDHRLRHMRTAMARTAAKFVMCGAFYHKTMIIKPGHLDTDGMCDD